MFKKKPILKYESDIEVYPDTISPAKNHIPSWYKKIPQWKNNVMFDINAGLSPTVKLCVPFLDTFTTGYMITIPYDLYVKNNNGVPYLTWPPGVKNPPSWRNEVADENIVPFNHFPIEYVWKYAVSYTFPVGYSFLFTHPLNRHDLPFTTLSGIIDGGLVMNAYGNAPFYIKKDFEGIIEKGTPIAQLIPFRQENWKSENVKGLVEIGKNHNILSGSIFKGWYKQTFWTKKQYE
jgi:hypothetical protein